MIVAGARAVLLSALVALLVTACGEDKMERGIPDHVDASTPVDVDELSMSEAERRAKEEKEMEKAEQRDFDAAQ